MVCRINNVVARYCESVSSAAIVWYGAYTEIEMAPNARAQKNHDELFSNHKSQFAITDPELIDVFDNFAFDEVLSHGNLPKRIRLMVQLGACIASQAVREFRVLLGASLSNGVTPVEAKEIVYQAVPYVGIAKVIDFLDATNEILTSQDVALPLHNQATTTPDTRFEIGREIQAQIIGEDRLAFLYTSAPDDLKHIQKYLSANCFGDYVSRGGLDLRTRELLTLSMLVSLGGCEPQLKGHIAANLRIGNDRSLLIDVLTQLIPFIGYPRTLNGLRMVDEVIPAKAKGQE